MFNTIGKGLVLLHTFLSLMLLVFGLSLYMNAIDWGWASPRSELDQRIASELDKSAVVFSDAVKMRDRAMVHVASSQTALAQAEKDFADNHLFYVRALQELRTAPNPIQVKAIAAEGLKLDKAGKPVLEVPVEGVDKSYVKYIEELKGVLAQVEGVEKEIREVAEESKKITFQLTGKDETGKKVRFGLYELIDDEYKTLQNLRAEREYIAPQWANALEEARLFTLRRQSLERTLERLEKK